MRAACLSLNRCLTGLIVLAAATGLVSSAHSATRLKLRCTVAPRTLPAEGGRITVRVNAGRQAVDALLVTLTRPNRTADTQALTALGGGQFEAAFTLPANSGRTVLNYSLKAFGRGEDPAGATANCGKVRVKAAADAVPFAVTSCRITPRELPAAGGVVHVEAQITGKRKGLVVRALVVDSDPFLQVTLTAAAGGIYRGDLTLPANTSVEQLNHHLQVEATVPVAELFAGMDCGYVGVAPVDTSAQISGIAVAGANGGIPQVRTFRSDTLDPLSNFLPFGRTFEGEATIAAADMDGDGITDFISAAGPGGVPQVRVIRGRDNQELHHFMAYAEGFQGGVFVAAGDVNGDGVMDVVTGAGAGSTGGHVKVFDGRDGSVLSSFLSESPGYTGGVRVAVGDVNGDGYADLVTGTGEGAAAHVKVFSGKDGSLLRSVIPFSASFMGGVYVGAGDLDGDGRAEVVVGAGGSTGGPRVKVFDGLNGSVVRDFNAYEASFTGGVRVATGDVNGDGHADVITGAGPGSAGGHVKVFDGNTGAEIRSFQAYDAGFTGGVSVAYLKVGPRQLSIVD
jgi:hypothetical protein